MANIKLQVIEELNKLEHLVSSAGGTFSACFTLNNKFCSVGNREWARKKLNKKHEINRRESMEWIPTQEPPNIPLEGGFNELIKPANNMKLKTYSSEILHFFLPSGQMSGMVSFMLIYYKFCIYS